MSHTGWARNTATSGVSTEDFIDKYGSISPNKQPVNQAAIVQASQKHHLGKRKENQDISALPPAPRDLPTDLKIIAKKQSKTHLMVEHLDNQVEYGYRLLQRTSPRNLPGIDLHIDASQRSLTRNNSNFNGSPMLSLGHSGSVQQLNAQDENYI